MSWEKCYLGIYNIGELSHLAGISQLHRRQSGEQSVNTMNEIYRERGKEDMQLLRYSMFLNA